jgi:hypothetical protein
MTHKNATGSFSQFPMSRNRVTYGVNDEAKAHLMMFPRDQKVSDFLEVVRQKQRAPDLCTVDVDGLLLDNDDQFDDWFVPDVIFRVRNSAPDIDGAPPSRFQRRFRVTYAVNDDADKTNEIKVPPYFRVGDFLAMVQREQGSSDLDAVYLNDGMLDNNDPFNCWFEVGRVFRVRDSPPALPAPRPAPGDGIRCRVTYAINDEAETWLIMFPRGQKVGDFLDFVKHRRGLPDLCAVYYHDVLLDNDDEFDDWFDPVGIYRVRESLT